MSPDIQKLEMIVGMIIMFISILVLTVIIFVKNDRVYKYRTMAIIFTLTGYGGIILSFLSVLFYFSWRRQPIRKIYGKYNRIILIFVSFLLIETS